MRELDVMLLRYLERAWPTAATAERGAFAELLELQDPELYGYLVGGALPSGIHQRAVVTCIRGLTA